MTLRKFQVRKQRAQKIYRALKKLHPNPKIALKFKSNWELLVSVILSAQTTDKQVNKITPALFKKYKTVGSYAKADLKKFQKDINKIGLYKNKAKNIIASAKIIEEKFNGKVPKTMKEILTLPGVARKTANVVLGNAYGVVEGIAVDTHVGRLAQKLDLTDHKDPVKIEKDLMELFPKSKWFEITYLLIDYGRHTCPRRRHECKNHPLSKIYPPSAYRFP